MGEPRNEDVLILQRKGIALGEFPIFPLNLFSGLPQRLGFLGSACGKEASANAGDNKRCWLDLWVGRIPWVGYGNPLSILPGDPPRSQEVRHD